MSVISIWNTSPDEQIVLFAGRVIPRKRVMELVHAFAQVHSQIPSARLRIAGEISTEPAYVESIRKWVHESHLDEHVRFLGPLPEESILREFAGCSLLSASICSRDGSYGNCPSNGREETGCCHSCRRCC